MITEQPGGTRFFQQDQLAFFTDNGWDITVISSPAPCLETLEAETEVKVVPIRMSRNISPLRDTLSFIKVFFAIYRINPDLISAGTPKAGLLGLLAAKILQVPARVYVLRGLRLETTSGPLRWLLYLMEKITALCAHEVICVSKSLRKKYLELKLTSPQKAVVLANGSSNGLDPDLYKPTMERQAAGVEIRQQLDIGLEDFVIGYIGRVAKDKGGRDLLDAYKHVRSKIDAVHLLIVGDLDETALFTEQEQKSISMDPNIHITGFVDDVSPYYHMIDVVVLPSYREGFPRVPLEAAGAEVPVVAYEATGTVDAVEHDKTGLLSEIGDSKALADNIISYASNEEKRHTHGSAGRQRVVSNFTSQLVWKDLLNKYAKLVF
ncbi:MAG: glycosyltransferase family 4 protein [Pirellulales bacterium]